MFKTLRNRITKYTPKVPPVGKRPRVGIMDDQLAGWFQVETGELVDGFAITADDTVVDVGCGDGSASTTFAAAQGAEIIAADIDPQALGETRRKLEKSRARRYETHVTDSNPLPLADERASRVIAMEVLEHVEDPAQFMSELIRVAQPGALFLLTVPDPTSEAVQKRVAPPVYWERPNHLRVFGRDDFIQLVDTSGLTIHRHFFRGFYWAVWWAMFWAADQEFGDPEVPMLRHWTESWHALITSPKGQRIKEALDAQLPKSQGIIAQKAA